MNHEMRHNLYYWYPKHLAYFNPRFRSRSVKAYMLSVCYQGRMPDVGAGRQVTALIGNIV